MKRGLDLLLSACAMVVLAIPMLLLALLVWRKLGSPVFFRQTRAGSHGRPFRMVKFRTMTDEHDCDGVLLPDAQRLTPFGRLLRNTSLDELPELWNVFLGDMSLVGPRPLLADYVPLYTTHQARRLEVKPGITGWAQINGRNGTRVGGEIRPRRLVCGQSVHPPGPLDPDRYRLARLQARRGQPEGPGDHAALHGRRRRAQQPR